MKTQAQINKHYHEAANEIIHFHPERTFQWYGDNLYWSAPQGWLLLAVNNTNSWFSTSPQTKEILNGHQSINHG